MGSVVSGIWHGLEKADPTGLATKINNTAEGVWNQNAAHGTEPVNYYRPPVHQYQPPTGDWAQRRLFVNSQPNPTGQGTGQPVQQQPQGEWTYVPGQGPVWQGGGGNRF